MISTTCAWLFIFNKLVDWGKNPKAGKRIGQERTGMQISKNQKRKLKCYGVVPNCLRTMSEQGSLAFSRLFADEVKTVKKRIYRRPYYSYQEVFDTTSPQFMRIDLFRHNKNLYFVGQKIWLFLWIPQVILQQACSPGLDC